MWTNNKIKWTNKIKMHQTIWIIIQIIKGKIRNINSKAIISTQIQAINKTNIQIKSTNQIIAILAILHPSLI